MARSFYVCFLIFSYNLDIVALNIFYFLAQLAELIAYNRRKLLLCMCACPSLCLYANQGGEIIIATRKEL